ncbi:MAG: coproporphyrinogen dehydrogenase HemZ [Oscillospiraceae bacterium]
MDNQLILERSGHPYGYEVECTARLFFPGYKMLSPEQAEEKEAEQDRIDTSVTKSGGGVELRVASRVGGDFREKVRMLPSSATDQERERALCTLLYELLCGQTGLRPPWGVLTGVRPVRLVHELLRTGKTWEEAERHFLEVYRATPEKTQLALDTARVQQPLLEDNASGDFSLYIGIPFCPTRCLYCSFVSHAIDRTAKLIPEYLDKLCLELEETGRIAGELGLRLRTVYMGGGTPTTLEAEQLDRILGTVADSFDLSGLSEYTVEAGRPDTLTVEKLAVLRRRGVERVSINPQTLDDSVLREIGRAHTVEDFYRAFEMAREQGFRVINTDLIAGLPTESADGFLKGLERIIALRPENITVHTLTVKRSSTLRERADAFLDTEEELTAALEESRKLLAASGYGPYYLYRQKGTRQNLENVGYALPGAESRYNIYMMEEVQTVLAVGAGAVTKLCGAPGRLERIFNFKYPYEYIGRFDEQLERNDKIRRFYEAN